MYFKLSARELQILEDRGVILERLRESQSKRQKSLKPPIIVVPTDDSRLVSVIERDERFNEIYGHSQSNCENSIAKLSEDELRDQEERQKAYEGSYGARLMYHVRRLAQGLRKRVSNLRQPTHDRHLQRHRKRLHDGLAISVHGTMLSTSVPVMHSGVDPLIWTFFANPMVKEMEETLSVKCDVCVLSNYNHVFKMLDAILEADILD